MTMRRDAPNWLLWAGTAVLAVVGYVALAIYARTEANAADITILKVGTAVTSAQYDAIGQRLDRIDGRLVGIEDTLRNPLARSGAGDPQTPQSPENRESAGVAADSPSAHISP